MYSRKYVFAFLLNFSAILYAISEQNIATNISLSFVAIISYTNMILSNYDSVIGFQEKAAVEVAKQSLLNAFKECLIKDAQGISNPTYAIPTNNRYFEFPDSGDDGVCFSPSSGNVLTAARTDGNGQTVSYFNININLKTGEKTTDRAIPSYLNWD